MSNLLLGIGCVLLLTGCPTPSSERPSAPTAAAPSAPQQPEATPRPGPPPVGIVPGAVPKGPREEVKLRLTSAPTGQAFGLTLTLLQVLEVAVSGERGPVFKRTAVLRVQRGEEQQELTLDGSHEVLGHKLTLAMAGDGEPAPGAPRESFAIVRVEPLP